MTNEEKIEEIIKKNKGFITHKDTEKNLISSFFLYDYVKKNDLKKQEAGFYFKKEWLVDSLFIFQYQFPKFIYSYNSALALNSLTNSIPDFLEVTGPKNYRPFSPKSRKEVYIHTDTVPATYSLGITEVKTQYGNKVKAYDPEKTICDIVRNKKQVDSETYSKALHFYMKNKNKDLKKLMHYAAILGIENKMQAIMEILIDETE